MASITFLLAFVAIAATASTSVQTDCSTEVGNLHCLVQTPFQATGLKRGKNRPEMDFGPAREVREKWLKNWENMFQKCGFGAICPFRPFFPHSLGSAKIPCAAKLFPIRARGPKWGLYLAIRIANRGRCRLGDNQPPASGPCGETKKLNKAGKGGISGEHL